MSNKKSGGTRILNINLKKMSDKSVKYEKVKSEEVKVFLKKCGENIAKLVLVVLSAVWAIPGMKSVIGAIGAMEANSIIGMISKIIANIKGLPLTDIGGQAINLELYANMSLPTGKYSWVGYLVQFCINLAINHPGIIVAGGTALFGLLTSKIIYPVIKKIAQKISEIYHNYTENKKSLS